MFSLIVLLFCKMTLCCQNFHLCDKQVTKTLTNDYRLCQTILGLIGITADVLTIYNIALFSGL